MPAVQIQSASGHHTGGTTTTLSTSIATGATPPAVIATAPLDEGFTHRLIEAVKAQPCLYNPNHEHYGNKHSSAQYRIQVWQKLCADLGFKDDAHALQMQWKRIRDRYVRERRKRRNASSGETSQDSSGGGRERHASGGSNCSTSSNATSITGSTSSRQFTEMMRWIEPYLIDNMTNNSFYSLPSTAITCSATGLHSQHLTTSQQQSNSSQGQNGGAVAVIASTAVSDAGTYYVHHSQTGSVKDESTSQDSAVNTADGVIVTSYQPNSQPHLVNSQNSLDYITSHSHGLPNGANCNRNANVVSTSTAGSARFADNASPCSSTTSSEIDVGTSTATAGSYSGSQQVSMQQQQSQQQRQRPPLLNQQSSSMLVLTAVQSQQASTAQQSAVLLPKAEQRPARIGQQLQTADGGVVTVTARGMAPVSGVIKKDVNVRTNDGGTVTMIIDPTTFYQHGSQKMYRLVNVSELSADAIPVSTSNSAQSVGGELKIVGIPQRRKRVATLSVPNGRGQLGDDVVLDDGISEKTITIDQGTVSGNERIVLDQRPGIAVGSTNVMLGHGVHQIHQQQLPNSTQQHPGISVSPHHATVSAQHASQIGLPQTSSLLVRQQPQMGQRFVTQAVSVEHPHYAVLPSQSLQEEHEANLAFANSIANHLSRLNEDEKAVAKMNIQRILMDARFGLGACARMIHDDELTEVAAVSTASHDVVTSQQHVDETSRRMT